MQVLTADVAIVGGGAAGCYAALNLQKSGINPLIICKGLVGESGASLFAGDLVISGRLLAPCPLCHTVLDGFQREIEKDLGLRLDMPVLHLSQLVGLAIDLSPDALNIDRHMISAGALSAFAAAGAGRV